MTDSIYEEPGDDYPSADAEELLDMGDLPEMDEYGNIYLSGYNLQILKLLENKFNMTTYIDKILEKYKKDIDYKQ